jgi:Aminotransferase class I and II
MEQVSALAERVKLLKQVAASMREGSIHTRLFPEVDKILALPDDLAAASVSEREAVTRQVREHEQTFDQLGYSLLKQIMPTTEVSPIFRVVQAAEAFRAEIGRRVGQTLELEGEPFTVEHHHRDVLTRYSLSIGTPPVTAEMSALVSRMLLGRPVEELFGFIDFLGCDPTDLEQLLRLLEQLVDSSLHYCTAAEEREFLRQAAEFVNFEGGRIFNRLVITESPDRVIELIREHLFDKFGSGDAPPVRLVEDLDHLDGALIQQMQAEPNQIFVARVTRVPHRIFAAARRAEPEANGTGAATAEAQEEGWRSVIGRLVLIDCSRRAHESNTTVVYTLFPHVARTLRNIQTSLAGRPANTQLLLRRLLERFSPDSLRAIREAVEGQLHFLQREGAQGADPVEAIRVQEWRRHGMLDAVALTKLRRLLAFFEVAAAGDDAALAAQGQALAEQVCDGWLRYFYKGLPPERYHTAVVPGGGRGTLTLIGAYHRQRVQRAVAAFREQRLEACRDRLAALKRSLSIPSSSTDEIQAAIKQSQLRALSPTQWQDGQPDASLADHLARSMLYRLADSASRVTRQTRAQLDRAAFGNLTGGAAAFLKRALSDRGFGALHGRLEGLVGSKVGAYDRRVRDALAPLSELIQATQRSIDDLRGDLDPLAVSEIEAVFELVEQGRFYPALVLPQLAWSYGDVFPDKDFPAASVIRIPLNERHEMDPLELLARLEELRYLFRRFPELFELYCQSMLLVLNTPHNPTGIVYRRETVLRLLKIAAEYGITVVDDNSYHKLVFSRQKAREGEDCVAQLYEKYRGHFTQPVRLLTAGATTKGLQGAGDRTGLLCTSDAEAVAFARAHASAPHQLSLFLTRAKLEVGLAAKQATDEVERIAGRLAAGGRDPWEEVRALLEALLPRCHDEGFPLPVFEALLEGYEELLRCQHRGAGRRELSDCLSRVVSRLKGLRLERRLRADVEQRVAQVRMAALRAGWGSNSDAEGGVPAALTEGTAIEPQGAFYYCLRLCEPGDERGLQEFLVALSRWRKIDVTAAGAGFVRLSLGGALRGDRASYDELGQVVEVYLRLLEQYWRRFEALGRDPERLDELFSGPNGDEGADPLAAALADLRPLLTIHSPKESQTSGGLTVAPSERGTIYCIEEGRSRADKVFVQSAGCESVEALLESRAFRVIYRRLLRRVYRDDPALAELPFEQLENQFGPLCCRAAYHDRQLIDGEFRRLLGRLYRAWHSDSTIRVLAAELEAERQGEKRSALRGINRKINELVNELMHAFELPDEQVSANDSFDVGLELLRGVEPAPGLPDYLARIVRGCGFAGATAPLNPAPTYVTGAVKRVADYRYGFLRRDGEAGGKASPGLEHFRARLDRFAARFDPEHYLCKAVQVGPFSLLLVVHKSCFHLICDELRLFPQIDAVSTRERLDRLDWDGVLLFGVPAKVMGDSYKTGYILDTGEGPDAREGTGQRPGARWSGSDQDIKELPTAWVAREDATDYTGFLKKSLLTLHNEGVKALGGMPVHGAMITITFVNGLRKTLVFSADSGTGKSETITAMMEQAVSGLGAGAELQRIDILAGDMLSLWIGEDGQLYAFGTETGDFLRLTDITESWKARYGDLLRRGSCSNLDDPKNPRVTIPGICDARKVLSPTRINAFFYINNYEVPRGSAVELSDDPHHVLKDVLVRGLRKNKGTSGDQPNLRAGLTFAGRQDLVTRFRHALDELLVWQGRDLEGLGPRTCLVYRDGAHEIYTAREVVSAAFRGRSFDDERGKRFTIEAVDYDLMRNLFWLVAADRRRALLDRRVYDQIYEPLVSTFCGNPFVDPEGMDETLGRFAETMRSARVHTGEIRTQLARPGCEFSGPDRAAGDVIAFLLEDEEVNARYQRNKDRVHAAMQRCYGGVLPAGGNLPVELEGYNLLLLEEYESTHVRLTDAAGAPLTLGTPFYSYTPPAERGSFVPAIGLPQTLVTIADIAANPDHDTFPLEALEIDPADYRGIRHHNSLEELAYQVLLVNGVVHLGASDTEVARFPGEVRKALHVARRLRV